MAIACQVPVVVFRLLNTAQFCPLNADRGHYGGKRINWGVDLGVIFSAPVTPDEYQGMTAEELTDWLKRIHDSLQCASDDAGAV